MGFQLQGYRTLDKWGHSWVTLALVLLALIGGGSSLQPRSIGSTLISDSNVWTSVEGPSAVDDRITLEGGFLLEVLGLTPLLEWLSFSFSFSSLIAMTFPRPFFFLRSGVSSLRVTSYLWGWRIFLQDWVRTFSFLSHRTERLCDGHHTSTFLYFFPLCSSLHCVCMQHSLFEFPNH